MPCVRTRLALALLGLAPIGLLHAVEVALPGVLVTAAALDEPAVMTADARAPRQPVPAHDGADILKTFPGFNVTRKGGADGDVVFRGLAGSRLGILVDGETLLGGCNARMDAPTAYIYPELYQTVTVIKGPQTVQHGSGNTAATVLFERRRDRFTRPGIEGYASALAASAARHDEIADVRFGNRSGYVRLTGSDSGANDYRDGHGDKVHSGYHRYSGEAAFGWTPDDRTRIELSGGRSDGKAAYADRAMDGTQFLRDSVSLRGEWRDPGPVLKKLEAMVYDSHVDHIMDDQTLRKPGMMGYADLKRDTRGGKVAGTLLMGPDALLTLGLDAQSNEHGSRSAKPDGVYGAWSDDADFDQQGLFAEIDRALGEQDRLVAGARVDRWKAVDRRRSLMLTGMGGMTMAMNPTGGRNREDTLSSGFLRLERHLSASPTTLYAGLSRSERFPDYWELIAKRGETANSAFDTARPEQTTQLDIGALRKDEYAEYSVSAYYNTISDFLLIDYSGGGMDKMTTGVTRNVDARTWGAELTAARRSGRWKTDAALAYAHGDNRTDGTPLAQMSPLEIRIGLDYATARWSAGGLLRLVDDQDRVDPGKGNIVGKDLARTPGFAVFSLNGRWQAAPHLTLSSGIDNLFNRAYAEAISRAGGAIPGYVQTTRVNEPGRTVWLKIAWTL